MYVKKFIWLLCLLVCKVSPAQQKLIHYWHFNNFSGTFKNPGIPSVAADYSILDASKARVAYKLVAGASPSYTGYIDNVTGDTLNARLGNFAGQGYRFRNPTDSAELWIYMPVKNYKNITVKYASQTSSLASGMLYQLFSYSTDSGATWKTGGLNRVSDTTSIAFKLTTVSMALDTAANNNNNLVFRIRFSGNTTGSSGNNRFDNISVEGDSILFPSGITTHTMQPNTVYVFPNPAADVLNINRLPAGNNHVSVLSLTGAVVLQQSIRNEGASLDIKDIPSGMYILMIRDENSNLLQASRFIKK